MYIVYDIFAAMWFFCILLQDNVPAEIADILQASDNAFISGLIAQSAHAPSTQTQGKAKKKTVLSKFKVQCNVQNYFTLLPLA